MKKRVFHGLAVFLVVFTLFFMWTPVVVNADMLTGKELLYYVWKRTWPFFVGLVAGVVILTALLIRRYFGKKRG